MLVCEPNALGHECDAQLSFGFRLFELAEPHSDVAADDDRSAAGLDHDDLRAACVTGRWDESDAREQVELAVDGDVLDAGRVHPLAHRVAVLAASVVELSTLDVNRLAREQMVPATVVGVEVGIDDDVDAAELEVLFVQWVDRGLQGAAKGAVSSCPCRRAHVRRDDR